MARREGDRVTDGEGVFSVVGEASDIESSYRDVEQRLPYDFLMSVGGSSRGGDGGEAPAKGRQKSPRS